MENTLYRARHSINCNFRNTRIDVVMGNNYRLPKEFSFSSQTLPLLFVFLNAIKYVSAGSQVVHVLSEN